MNRAVFFDRDGVINSDDGLYYVFKSEDFKINPGVLDCMKILASRGFLLIVISNQGGISRGKYTKTDAANIHLLLQDECRKAGFEMSEIYFCPHHNEIEKCICRKPGTQMLEKAIARFDIDKRQSFFVGDRETDVETAKNAGIQPILVKANGNLMECLKFIPD
jgi:D-glycero-D-manno-heptose 1,7-bisphosphate phosphatase